MSEDGGLFSGTDNKDQKNIISSWHYEIYLRSYTYIQNLFVKYIVF